MAYTLTAKFTAEDVINAFAEQGSLSALKKVVVKVIEKYGSWTQHLDMTAFLVEECYKGYIKKHYDDKNIPEQLIPLIKEAIQEDFRVQLEQDKGMSSDDYEDEDLAARDYMQSRVGKVMDYDEFFLAFTQGAEWMRKRAKMENKPLDEYSDEQLLNELKKRMK